MCADLCSSNSCFLLSSWPSRHGWFGAGLLVPCTAGSRCGLAFGAVTNSSIFAASVNRSVLLFTRSITSASRRVFISPLRFAITSRPSRCEEDLHLLAVKHARHTKKWPPQRKAATTTIVRCAIAYIFIAEP